MIFFLISEISQANIPYRRAKRLRVATGDLRLKRESEVDPDGVTVKDNLVVWTGAFNLTSSGPTVPFMVLSFVLIYGNSHIW